MTHFGIGYDVHPFAPGRPLILGGVRIEHPLGLEGHSDADVLSHAIADALLGAVAQGDIGQHFPNTDESLRGISSLEILRQVRVLLDRQWSDIVNIDATLIAQEPRIAPHADAMKANLSEALGLPMDRISIKATTNEGLGFIGRGEGIAAMAVASVRVRESP
jgi:2-C-methyl-D-erythritol 2,4-cyclodiphosphate synthase